MELEVQCGLLMAQFPGGHCYHTLEFSLEIFSCINV
uniref:Uncharacterized protein n=1 Tax=Anguilla anguilla TaxID=7936 RepID=A0A0E9SIE1_ANGAN